MNVHSRFQVTAAGQSTAGKPTLATGRRAAWRARLRRGATAAWVSVLAAASAGCGGGVPAIAESNRVFYAYDTLSDAYRASFERPYPPLDLGRTPRRGEYKGFTILNGKVHISRPADWVMRGASDTPGRRFVQYVSPKEYIFSVYEWPDLPDTPWREVMTRFERDASAAQAEILEQRIPTANWNAQGRGYVLRRRVHAARGPLVNTSDEYLTRNANRIVLVQVVHQGPTLELEAEELMRVLETLDLV